jgi:enediyne biosynthesis protein E4
LLFYFCQCCRPIAAVVILMRPVYLQFFFILLVTFDACSPAKEKPVQNSLFRLVDPAVSNIRFENNLSYTEELNTYTFKNFYNGGGVGVGDFNNDKLPDIFFSGNQVANKLYLNKGNFVFEDISSKAGISVPGVWSTGVSTADINADGLLDIYVCKSGPPGGDRRYNELFINNGDLTFREEAKTYGLAFEGLSTHAAFFDYDMDGDLDCYLLNNSIRSVGGYDLRKDQRTHPDTLGGNKLLRNEGGKYSDVTLEAGIYSSEIGFGLGVTIGDINQDQWPDIYISNDFFERDYVYINNKNGTFREELEQCMQEISLGSMGADMADINNDALPDIFVTEMLPENDERLKTTSQFDSWDRYQQAVRNGYHHQFSRNALQLNNGDGTFSEVSRLAGVQATDWSWGALIFDMDNDGMKDIFVANGIYKDLINQDYINFIANPDFIRKILQREKNVLKRLIDSIPSNKLPNYAFHNSGGLSFVNKAEDWGLGTPTHSNGSAYADLDNDGDLDLILNNVNMPAFVYENRSNELLAQNATLSISLTGDSLNRFAIGSKITAWANGRSIYQELNPMRGFMSSVDYKICLGLGACENVDSLVIAWPDGRTTAMKNVKPNQHLQLVQKDAVFRKEYPNKENKRAVLKSASVPGVDFVHAESEFVDFDRDRLLYNMISNEGPCLCTGDINGDGLDDFYVGGARNQPGALYVQQRNGGFNQIVSKLFEADRLSEDSGCALFDANGDGRDDLYVASGSNEFSPNSTAYLDRLYVNQGKLQFKKSDQLLPVAHRFESTSAVAPFDYDGDGDTDLFVGVRSIPFYYGLSGNGYILNNDGHGNFSDVTSKIAPALIKAGMITDVAWVDINRDTKADLLVVGEWMPVKVLIYEDGKFHDRSNEYGLADSNGWYHTISVADFNNDGMMDFIAGNHGLNSRFKASRESPISLYVNDFDRNGTVEQITTHTDDGKAYPFVLRQDIVTQIPYLKKEFLHFSAYKDKSIDEIFKPEQVANSVILNAYDLATSLWLNNGKGGFVKQQLPAQAQFSPVYGILVDDFNKDGNADILLGGNLFRAKPETGIYAASFGCFLQGDGSANFVSLPPESSGVSIKGEIRSMEKLVVKGRKTVVIGKNNDRIDFLKYE